MIFVEIFHDFGWLFATRIRVRFIEADPDPADQNETIPNGSGSETLVKMMKKIGQNKTNLLIFSAHRDIKSELLWDIWWRFCAYGNPELIQISSVQMQCIN